jgi:hypothetical protein
MWWSGLPAYSKVFYCCAIPATIILILHVTLTLFGLAGDIDVDLDGDLDGDTDVDGHGLPIFTLRNFEAFFAMFGWGGLLGIENGLPVWLSSFLGVALGSGSAIGMAFFISTIYDLQRSGTSDQKSVVGKKATVYMQIPEKGKGFGKINVEIDGIIRERKAVSSGETIDTGSEVLILSYSNNIFTVERSLA